MNEHLRQTGRTTRLVEQACREAYAGRAVYLLVPGHDQVRWMEDFVNRTWAKMVNEARPHGIKVENMRHWDDHRLWDWAEMQPMPRNHHSNCLFLVDHTAVEIRLEQVQRDIKHLAELAGKLYPHTV